MADQMELSLVGMLHRLTPSTIHRLADEVAEHPLKCRLEREPDNPHDANAIKVILESGRLAKTKSGFHIGYIKRAVASVIAPVMDAGDWDFTRVKLMLVDDEAGEGELLAKRKA